ncbi:MAG: phage head-tail connector protein [Bacillota bacterium]|nr:phage head-tail connector protein [Bacillota bacterium]
MLEVLTPATNTRLTLLGTLKSELGISDTSQDALLSALIDQASGAIMDYCGRPFAKETYKETVPGYGSNRLLLSRTPIVSVASVVADSEVIVDYSVENPEAGILYRKVGWRWTPPLGWNVTYYPMPGQEELLFAVTYTAGYVLPGDTGTRTLPQAVERACIELVKAWFLGRDRDPALTGQRIGDLQVSYDPAQAWPPIVERLLAPYRRVV